VTVDGTKEGQLKTKNMLSCFFESSYIRIHMPRILFELSEEQMAQLRHESITTGVPMVQFVRQALIDYFHHRTSLSFVVSGCIVSGVVLVVKGG